MGLAETAGAVSGREVTAVAVTAAALDRIASVEPALNAYTHIDPDRSLEMAAIVDERVAKGETLPLAGVPFAVKDLIDQAGWPNSRGASFPPTRPALDAPCVARLADAGAVPVGRTGLHEFAFGFSSENEWHGPVHNPWDPSLSPGGSSGGSAAAVASGSVPISLGTDTGGSVRVPAALCGIVGLKVTHGRGSLRGVFPLVPSIDTVGPLGRTVADVAAAYTAIAAHDPSDPWSAPMIVEPATAPADLSKITVGIVHPWADAPTTETVASGFEWALDRLSGLGVEIVHVDEEALDLPGQLLESMYYEAASVHRERFADAPDRYGAEVRERLQIATRHTPRQYLDGLRWRAGVRHGFERALGRCDVLVTPTVAALRKPIGATEIDVAGSMVPYRSPLSVFTSIVNHAALPAIAVPLDVDGAPPPSLQIVGPAWSEARLIEIGLGLEAAGVVRTRRPPVFAE